MPTDRTRRISEVSQAAMALEPEKQAAFLERACADDPGLRNEVEALLARQAHLTTPQEPPPTEKSPHADTSPIPPEAIAGYKILKELSRGGQGVVYQAVQQSTKRKVAMKVLLEGPFAGAASKRRFEREIELVGSLRHPHIVPIFDSGVSEGRFYYVMEYIRGEPLARYVEKRKLSVEETLRLFGKVCEAVDYAHQRGVIHRDLKPSNILVDTHGEPHVLDFGLAKIGGAEATGEAESMLVSETGQIIGTVP
ncbi:MAG: serine/threonine-protein kinase, partial [Thermoguttaceae bacterium]